MVSNAADTLSSAGPPAVPSPGPGISRLPELAETSWGNDRSANKGRFWFDPKPISATRTTIAAIAVVAFPDAFRVEFSVNFLLGFMDNNLAQLIILLRHQCFRSE
jgi:hypothetical protein